MRKDPRALRILPEDSFSLMLLSSSLPGLLFLLLLVTGSSCTSTNRLLKARPAPAAEGFLDRRLTPNDQTGQSPWHYAGFTTDRTVLGMAAHRKRLYIAPVRTGQLRPVSKTLAEREFRHLRPGQRDRIAREMRRDFAWALTAQPGAPFQLSLRPHPQSLILELNLIELDPTSVRGNVTKAAVKYTLGPIAGMGIGVLAGGRIAMEGRLRDGSTGAVLLQFADREKDKATLYSARDYQALGHASHTLREWSGQLRAFLQPRREPVRDSLFFTPALY